MYNIAKARSFLPEQEWKTFEMNPPIPVGRFHSTKKNDSIEQDLLNFEIENNQINASELRRVIRFFSYASLISMVVFIGLVLASFYFKDITTLATLSSIFLFAWVIFGFSYSKIIAVVT